MKIKKLFCSLFAAIVFSATGIITASAEEAVITAANPATGVNLGVTAAVVCGLLVVGCIIFTIISKKKKK